MKAHMSKLTALVAFSAALAAGPATLAAQACDLCGKNGAVSMTRKALVVRANNRLAMADCVNGGLLPISGSRGCHPGVPTV